MQGNERSGSVLGTWPDDPVPARLACDTFEQCVCSLTLQSLLQSQRCELELLPPAAAVRAQSAVRRLSRVKPGMVQTQTPSKASQADPEDPAQLKAAGNAAFKASKLEHAIDLYSCAMAAAPDDAVYVSNRSAALFEAGRYASCVADVGTALQRSPSDALAAKLALRAARAELWGGNIDAAEAWLSHQAIIADASTAEDQVKELREHVAACREAAKASASASDELRAVAAGIDCDAPGLLRDCLFPLRPDMYATGHDVVRSMLDGACWC